QHEAHLVSLQKELDAVDLRIRSIEVRATVSGLVTRLAVTHAGRVVPEGSTIAEISPSGHDLVLEAYVRNDDRGSIHEKQGAKLRFAAFPYQDYGAVEGEVLEVAPDATRAP